MQKQCLLCCVLGSAYFLQTAGRSWFEAQEYCREQNMDLASVMDETEATEIAKEKLNLWVWIGLYRKPWAYWSDKQSVTFTHWASGQPTNIINTNCVKMSTTSGKWFNDLCNIKLSFVCQENVIPQHQTRLKVKISSAADMNDPEVQRQLLEQVQ